MGMHDDYFDITDAFKRWDRAYVNYGKAVDNGRPQETCVRAARKLAQRLRELSSAALGQIETMKHNGWPTEKGQRAKDAAKPVIERLSGRRAK